MIRSVPPIDSTLKDCLLCKSFLSRLSQSLEAFGLFWRSRALPFSFLIPANARYAGSACDIPVKVLNRCGELIWASGVASISENLSLSQFHVALAIPTASISRLPARKGLRWHAWSHTNSRHWRRPPHDIDFHDAKALLGTVLPGGHDGEMWDGLVRGRPAQGLSDRQNDPGWGRCLDVS